MMLGEATHNFSYQRLHNVELHKYTQFEQSIPCSTRFMNIFTKRAQSARMILGETSSPFSYQKLDNIKLHIKYSTKNNKKEQKKSIQNLNQMHNEVQEL